MRLEFENHITELFRARMKNLGSSGQQLEKELSKYTGEENLLFRYIYSSLPTSDLVNYPIDVFADCVNNAMELLKNKVYVDQYDEELFLQYVLLPRVNNEELRPCRKFFRQEIEPLIKGKSDEEAAIEVNYWCAANCSYHASDGRTMSAFAVYESGSGRCGEESTFLVNALRSVGIASRQVYVPRWSHCDDNHAWVEVYVGDAWHYMGACEPEERLDHGWFTNAAGRAMSINSKFFGPVLSEKTAQEDILMAEDGVVSLRSQLPRYAKAGILSLTVLDADGQPIPDADVHFQVMNYSEFVDVAELRTDSAGRVSVQLGLGSIVVFIHKGEIYQSQLIDTEIEESLQIVLSKENSKNAGFSDLEELNIIAPTDKYVRDIYFEATEPESGTVKLAEVDARRTKKMQDVKNPELEKFLYKGDHHMLRKELVDSLSEKDRKDVPGDVLEECLLSALIYLRDCAGNDKEFSETELVKYVFCPRIESEPLSCYREFLKDRMTLDEQKDFRDDPEKICDYINEKVRTDSSLEYSELVTWPKACILAGTASEQSKKILFVAIARSLGIPSYLDRVGAKVTYYHSSVGKWETIEEKDVRFVKVIFTRTEDIREKSTYWNNWSFAGLCQGVFRTLDLSGLSWKDDRIECLLPAGRYRLLTSNRLPDGDIYAYEEMVKLSVDNKEFPDGFPVRLKMREVRIDEMLEKIRLKPFTLRDSDGNQQSVGGLLQEKVNYLFFLEEGREPTEHIVNEIIENKVQYETQTDRIHFVLRNKYVLQDKTISCCLSMIPGIAIEYDDLQSLPEQLAREVYAEPGRLPLIMIIDKDMNCVYANGGYNVGAGKLLLEIADIVDRSEKPVIEICCGSVEDALAAFRGGAGRVELNSALYMGGLTPSLGSLQRVKEETDLDVIVMVRPRGAGFSYSESERKTMLKDAELMMQNGADGIAFGFLNGNGTIDCDSTEKMVKLIHEYGGKAVFHRAFDCTHDLIEAMEELIKTGADRILTSGGCNTATEGRDMLRRLRTIARDRIEIIAGSGINEENCSELMRNTGIRQIHSSCKEWVKDPTTSSDRVSYSYAQGADRNSYNRVSEEKVRKLCAAVI